MRKSVFFFFFFVWALNMQGQQNQAAGDRWELVWSDEFDREGKPDDRYWNYENGFVRNQELQWYQPENVFCREGRLVIEGRREQRKNPRYEAGSDDWRKSRPRIGYTSSSVTTAGKKEFLYGRLEVRAKIPVAGGAWPAIWTLGKGMEWPSCGEIDVMEYYRIQEKPHILANVAWGTDRRWEARWNTRATPYEHFLQQDPEWAQRFHVWRMDWDEEAIRIYLDDELLHETFLKDTGNGTWGEHRNPFRQPHYILLNLAIGGANGGTPEDEAFPLRYEVDWVRVYKKR